MNDLQVRQRFVLAMSCGITAIAVLLAYAVTLGSDVVQERLIVQRDLEAAQSILADVERKTVGRNDIKGRSRETLSTGGVTALLTSSNRAAELGEIGIRDEIAFAMQRSALELVSLKTQPIDDNAGLRILVDFKGSIVAATAFCKLVGDDYYCVSLDGAFVAAGVYEWNAALILREPKIVH